MIVLFYSSLFSKLEKSIACNLNIIVWILYILKSGQIDYLKALETDFSPADFQTAYEGEFLCLYTVSFFGKSWFLQQ